MRCPKCGGKDRLFVAERRWLPLVEISPGTLGASDCSTVDEEPYWDDDSTVKCEGCGFESEARQFD